MSTVYTHGYTTLGADINKNKRGQEAQEGVVSDKLPELTLDMDNEELKKLTKQWEATWRDSNARQDWYKIIDENERYWLGKHHDNPKADISRTITDNVIFESLETYLPQATSRNPEPIVSLSYSEEETKENIDYTIKVKSRLAELADLIKLRLKLKRSTRYWALYLLGAVKLGWDLDNDTPSPRVLRPHRLILDPDATIDEEGYSGQYIGEYRKMTAGEMLAILSEAGESGSEKVIRDMIETDKKGTEIKFVEWWTPQYFCWILKDDVLLKKKNPHWNYDEEEEDEEVDDYGNATPVSRTVEGVNHLPVPRMPYVFLSVYNLGDQPMDKTSLISQNLSSQDIINKRNRQIDRNADRMNGGMVVSLERSGLTRSQARSVSDALRKGGVITIPQGSPREAIDDYAPTSLPADVYTNLSDMRNRLRDVFGTKGSTPAGISEEKTVRGKIINRGLDSDRIGGSISEHLEQFADDIYNWMLQLLYVYDSGFQFLNAKPPKILISVREGSLLPKDSISIANEAIELASANKMSLLDLYKRLEYPNPEELAANVWLEQNAPHLLYKDNPDVQEALGAMQPQQEAPQQEQGIAPPEEKSNSLLGAVPIDNNQP